MNRRRILASVAKSGFDLHGYSGDGLLAYFDAIDNVGLGDDNHDSSSKKCVNLAGNSFIENMFSNGSWKQDEKSFYNDRSLVGIYDESTGNAAKGGTHAFSCPNGHTMQIVARFHNDDNSARKFGWSLDAESPWLFHEYQISKTRYLNKTFDFVNMLDEIDMSISTTVDGSGNLKHYQNGILVATGSGFGALSISEGRTLLLSNYYLILASWGINSRLRAFRLYSRELSSKEVYDSYIVDKARFGLA